MYVIYLNLNPLSEPCIPDPTRKLALEELQKEEQQNTVSETDSQDEDGPVQVLKCYSPAGVFDAAMKAEIVQ